MNEYPSISTGSETHLDSEAGILAEVAESGVSVTATIGQDGKATVYEQIDQTDIQGMTIEEATEALKEVL